MKNIKKLALVLLILLVSPLITAIAICRFYLSSIESAALGHLSMIFNAKWQNFCIRKILMPALV